MDIKEKLSSISGISKKSISQLINYMSLIYSNEVVKQVKFHPEEPVKLDTMEGQLIITLDEDDCINFKFIPSEDFSKMVQEAYLKKRDILKITLDKKVKEILENTYKGLL